MTEGLRMPKHVRLLAALFGVALVIGGAPLSAQARRPMTPGSVHVDGDADAQNAAEKQRVAAAASALSDEHSRDPFVVGDDAAAAD